MCGIVGFIGDSDTTKWKAFEQLLYINALRGMDSTGVFTVNTQDQVKMARAVGEPSNLLVSREYKSASEFPGLVKVAVGHNRFGTGGGVSKETAHPFDFDNLIGVHNGVIGSKYRFDKPASFKVDSEAMYSHMSEHGVNPTIALMGGHGNSYSLVFWDKTTDTINFLRNNERPMFFVVCDDNKTMFFASEPWMIYGVLGRNGIKHGEAISTDVHTLYSFDVKQSGLTKPVVRSVEPPKPLPTVIYSTGRSGTQVTGTATSTKEVATTKKDITVRGIKGSKVIIECKVVTEFEIEGHFIDSNGSAYVRCKAKDNKVNGTKTFAPFRLYYRKDDEWVSEAVGEKIFSKVNSFTENEVEGVFYKLSPWDVTSDVDVSAIEEGDEEQLVAMTHEGQVVEMSKWRRKYPSCGWCGESIAKPDNCSFIHGEAICETCSADEDIVAELNQMS